MHQRMDRFGVVPPDILCEILKLLPDLHTLQNLRRASPAVNSLLHEDGPAAEIVESIMSSNLAYPIQFKVRLIALLVWGPDGHNILLESPNDLRDTLWGPRRENPPERAKHRDTVGRRSLTRYTGLPSAVLVRVVTVAGQVHQLAHRCFHTLLARVLASQPRRPTDPTLTNREYAHSVNAAVRARAPFPLPGPAPESELVPFPPAATASPSWGEARRFEADSWEYALQAILLHLPSGPVTLARQKSIGQIFQPPEHHIPPVWINYGTLKECLPEQPMRLSEAINILPAVQHPCCQGDPLFDHHEEWKPPEYAEQDRLLVPLDRYISRTWLISPTKHEQWSPIFQGDLHDFDHLGFLVWCRKRMAALGFMAHDDEETRRNRVASGPMQGNWPCRNAIYSDLFACRSVMSARQVEIMQERSRRWWADNVLHAPPRGT